MNAIGPSELLLMLSVSIIWLLPVAAAIWALVILLHLRSGQRAMALRLDNIERLLDAERKAP